MHCVKKRWTFLKDTPLKILIYEILFVLGVCLLTIFTPLGSATIIILPALFAFLAVRRGWFSMLGTLTVVLIVCVLYWGPKFSIVFLVILIPPLVILTYFNKRKRGSFEWLLAVCGSFLASVALVALVVFIMTGKGPITVFCSYVTTIFQQSQPGSFEYGMMSILGYVKTPGDIASIDIQTLLNGSIAIDKASFIPQAVQNIRSMLNNDLPTVLLDVSLLGGLFNFQFCRFMIRRSHGEINEMKPFSQWQIPDRGVWGLLIIVLIIGGGSLLGIDLCTTAFPYVLEILSLIYVIQGTAFILFLMQRRKTGVFFRIFIFALLFIFIPIAVVICGIAEQFLRLRQKMLMNDKNNPL